MFAEIILVVTTYVVDALSFAKHFLPLKLATPLILEVDMI